MAYTLPFLSENNSGHEFSSVKILSPNQNMQEAAANLFSFLHEFESEKLDLIVCEKITRKGLGKAIMDRLTRAVKKFEKN